ncbi:MAG: peptidylprolyl isomerase [Pseudomonadota bacterium]
MSSSVDGAARRPLRVAGAALLSAVMVASIAPAAAKKKKKDEDLGPKPSEIVKAAPDDAWRTVDTENILLMDVPTGVIVIEMMPQIAPLHVERIKKLTREGFYDGLRFHRVIEGFVAQGGDPNGDGTGGSSEPDLQPEFTRDTAETERFAVVGRDRMAGQVGFVDGLPAAAEPEALRSFLTERRVDLWGAHCPGVMSMARAARPDSANSQFFLTIGDARQSLDERYTVWGAVRDGFENTRRIERGEPPRRPTPIVRMRIAADVPAEERPNVQVMRTESDTFASFLDATKLIKDGAVRDLCVLKVPVKVNGKAVG